MQFDPLESKDIGHLWPDNICYVEVSQFHLSNPAILLHYSTAPAGFPSPAADYLEKLDLIKYLIKTEESTFFVRVVGESMIDAFIPPNGLLIVDKSIHARSGHIIVAALEGRFTVKRLQLNDAGVFLLPENDKYKPVQVTEGMNFHVWGVVTRIIIDTKDV